MSKIFKKYIYKKSKDSQEKDQPETPKETSENATGAHTKLKIMQLIYEELCYSETELDAILRELRVSISKNII